MQKVKRETISKKTRFEVFKRDSFTCQYCGKSSPDVVLHVDHIHPVSLGGGNDILNLVTACAGCNSGKSNRTLSDKSSVTKQIAQLKKLQEREEQLKMLVEWRESMASACDAEVKVFEDALRLLTNRQLSEKGKTSVKTWLKKFSIEELLCALDASTTSYLKDDKNETIEKVFQMVPKIAAIKKEPAEIQELFYIRGIIRKRFTYCNDWQCMNLLKKAVANGYEIGSLKTLAVNASNWSQWRTRMEEITGDVA